MGVAVKGNVVTVFHRGDCTTAQGKKLATDLLQVCEMLCQLYDSIVVYHDASRIENVESGYGDMIAAATAHIGCCGTQIAAMPSPVHRIMARTGVLFGHTDVQIYKQPIQVQYWLRRHRGELTATR